jgi:electron transfer flavoprotein alpha/beta subunit
LIDGYKEDGMNSIVCIKQVPNVREVSWDPETGSLIRKGVPSIINPNDRNAIEAALQLKEEFGGKVVILSMGPSQVEEALREALAMGADEAIQLTDKRFAGSDTWATSYTLGLAVKKIAKYDIILCGKEAIDGMTAQVGPELAECLNIPQLTCVLKIKVDGTSVTTVQRLGKCERVLQARLPALITVERDINKPRVPPMDMIFEAYAKEIKVWKAADLSGEETNFGLAGSPTRLTKVYTPKFLRAKVEMLKGGPEDAARKAVEKLKERFII